MKLSTLSFFAAVVALAGCDSQSQIPLPRPAQREIAQSRSALPVCGGSRIGQAQCDVLLESGGAHRSYAGWTASDLETAYNLPSSTKGKGQSVYVVDAYDNPDVATDFAEYRSEMGLPKGTLNKYNQDGQMSNYPQGSAGWGVEIALDVEMVSASCPKCTVNLVEANSSQWSDIETAEAEAVTLGATIISNSFDGTGASESYFDTKGVEYLASSGDSGLGLYDPAVYDSVAAVGGTQLATAGNKRGYTESVWSDSGGGCETGGKKPWWQKHYKFAKSCDGRLGSDVSSDATDAAEYDTYEEGGWITVDGTSISSPFCAGIFALAGNSTKQDGGRTFWVPASHHKYLYEIGGKRFTDQGGWGSPHGSGAF